MRWGKESLPQIHSEKGKYKIEKVLYLTVHQIGLRLQVPEYCSYVSLNIFALRSKKQKKMYQQD